MSPAGWHESAAVRHPEVVACTTQHDLPPGQFAHAPASLPVAFPPLTPYHSRRVGKDPKIHGFSRQPQNQRRNRGGGLHRSTHRLPDPNAVRWHASNAGRGDPGDRGAPGN